MNAIEKQQLESRQVKMMMAGEGWKIIERDFLVKSKELTTDLINAHDMGEVTRLQAEIKTFQTFFEIVAKHYKVKTD